MIKVLKILNWVIPHKILTLKTLTTALSAMKIFRTVNNSAFCHAASNTVFTPAASINGYLKYKASVHW